MFCKKCGKELSEGVKFCDGCAEGIETVIENPPKKKRSKILIVIIAFVAAVALALVALVSIGGDSQGSLTVPYNNDTGAVMNMTLDEFTADFGVKLDELFVAGNLEPQNFDLSPYWSNKVEPMTDYEENSGAEYTLYTAFLTNVNFYANIQGEKISNIKVCFDYDDNRMANTFAVATFMLCGNMDFEEANKIFETVRNGIMDNTMVYKDGIVYCINSSTVSYEAMAASEEFIQKLESSGKCNVIRW